MFLKLNLLLPSAFFAIAGIFGTLFFTTKKEGKNISIKVFILYSAVTLLIFALIGLSGLFSTIKPLKLYVLLQCLVLILGGVHAYSLLKLDKWNEHESFVHELIFTIYVAIIGALAFIVVFSLCEDKGYALLFTSSILLFVVPFFVVKCFDFMLQIPEVVYPKWYFPIGQPAVELPEELFEDTSVAIVEFRMKQNAELDSEVIKSRTRLPLKTELSKFFPVFLEEFNDRNPGRKIQYLDEKNEAIGWNFYIHPKWWQFKNYINPDLTVRENEIKENNIIIAERV